MRNNGVKNVRIWFNIVCSETGFNGLWAWTMSFDFILPTVQKVKLNCASLATKQSRCGYKMCVWGEFEWQEIWHGMQNTACGGHLFSPDILYHGAGTTLTCRLLSSVFYMWIVQVNDTKNHIPFLVLTHLIKVNSNIWRQKKRWGIPHDHISIRQYI